MHASHAAASLFGRLLISIIFILAGFEKITGYQGTAQYMESFGVPGILLPGVIALELVGGLMILFGVFSRYAALALAFFTVVAGLVFHSNFADPVQLIMFLKNLAIAGGLLLLSANGPGAYAIRD
ncbi:MAG: DoxX family protein [Hyphomicrobium sp.]|nr:DoxX family protein [Hyphomicrobium sp.]